MNEDLLTMMNIYQTHDVDWMGYKIKNLSSLTIHHIVKKEKNGIDDISNYALLSIESHHLLHYMEVKYKSEYMKLNELFLSLNKSLLPPDSEYYDNVNKILKKVNKGIKNENRKRKIKKL